jgi:hypothetical protein
MIALLGLASNTKHVHGLWEGATENSVACKALLDDLVARGLDPKRKRLFVIDGSGGLALRVIASTRSVARCRLRTWQHE